MQVETEKHEKASLSLLLKNSRNAGSFVDGDVSADNSETVWPDLDHSGIRSAPWADRGRAQTPRREIACHPFAVLHGIAFNRLRACSNLNDLSLNN